MRRISPLPGIVTRALTQEINHTDNPLATPRSLASVAAAEDAATLTARAEWLAMEIIGGRRIAALPKPERKSRRKYDKAGPPSTMLEEWVMSAPNDELFAALVRNWHPEWFLQRLSVDGARDYVLEHQWKVDKHGNIVSLG
jgi:hypothetical protein